MYISGVAKPVNQPDALGLLLNRIPRGGDAVLIADGEAGRVLLDLAADSLSGRRTRILRVADVLPGRLAALTPMAQAAGPAKGSVPEDEALSRSFQAMTVLDPACDRAVLLVGDAHALPRPALRYIQFAARSAAHLQLVFCGTRALFDVLNVEEFTWLRLRLKAGLVLTLAAPIPEDFDEPPVPVSVPDDPAAWAGEAATLVPGAQRPAVSAGRRSWPLRLGALAVLGLGGAASLMLAVRGGGADRPEASQQALSVVMQPPVPAAAPAPGTPVADAAPQADPGAASAATPDTRGAGPGSPPAVPATLPALGAPGTIAAMPSQPRAVVPEPEPPPGLARSVGRPAGLAAASRPATATPGNRARRLREARDQGPRDDDWAQPQPEFGSWTAPSTQPTRYIGSYTTDASGVRAFRPGP